MRIKELLQRQEQSTEIAIKSDKESLTYKQWNERAADLSKRIAEQTSPKSRNIAIFLPNSISYAVAYLPLHLQIRS